MLAELVERAASGGDEAVEELAARAAADPASLTPYLPRLLEAGVTWPQVLYRGADEAFQREVVRRVDDGDPERLYALLLILAHTTGPVAEQAFLRWQERPPPGADALHVPIARIPVEGGWLPRAGGARRLCGDRAFELAVRDTEDGRPQTDRLCPWCGNPLWIALDVDTADPRTAAALAHTGWTGRLRVLTCHYCVCYGTTYAHAAPDGLAEWSQDTPRPDALPQGIAPGLEDPPPSLEFTVGEARPSPYAADAWNAGGSTLGGHPDWIQNADVPDCPDCGEAMDYVGTVAGPDIDRYLEGANYLFLHAACRRAATVYQQS
ncbi:hypothetical protein ACFVH6_27695 [Spirillospora sp. NPDC127200]